MPNPAPTVYETVAELINRFRINCRNVYIFNLDEWANENGEVAPETYPAGFNHSFLKSFYDKIDPDLRMKRANCCAPTTENIRDYSKRHLLLLAAPDLAACPLRAGHPAGSILDLATAADDGLCQRRHCRTDRGS